jgi:hypothetical protein
VKGVGVLPSNSGEGGARTWRPRCRRALLGERSGGAPARRSTEADAAREQMGRDCERERAEEREGVDLDIGAHPVSGMPLAAHT